uniref:Uncharacterized protein n=1 Tax=Lepeophtheirus salmonis TaxID=72036 RepID=A0A0K2TXD1_LEPSM
MDVKYNSYNCGCLLLGCII